LGMATRLKKRKADELSKKDELAVEEATSNDKSSSVALKKRKPNDKSTSTDESTLKVKGKSKGKNHVEDDVEVSEDTDSSKAVISGIADSVKAINVGDSSLKIMNLLGFDGKLLKNDQEFYEKFYEISNVLLNDVILYINEKPHRLDEIEFYYNAYSHQDIFAHCDLMQVSCGKWYFHKSGNTYKSGTYKGMDITFGNTANNKFGGILIRSFEELSSTPPLDGKIKIMEGPCVCVDYILNENECDGIIKFVADFCKESQLDVTKTKKLYLKFATTEAEKKLLEPHRPIFPGPRVGLSLKKNDPAQYRFVMKNYRFLTQPKLIKKGKAHIIAGLIGEATRNITSKGDTSAKISLNDIKGISGVTMDNLTRYEQLFQTGKIENKPEAFEGKALANDEVLSVYGNCWATLNS